VASAAPSPGPAQRFCAGDATAARRGHSGDSHPRLRSAGRATARPAAGAAAGGRAPGEPRLRGRRLIRRFSQRGVAAAAAVIGLAVATTGAWSSQIAPGARLAPIAAVAAALAAGWLRPRAAVAALLAWIPAAVLWAGAPAATLAPRNWPTLIGQIGGGAAGLFTPGVRPAGGPWPLVAVLLGSGALWVAGGALAATAPAGRRRRIGAFCALAAPWVGAVGLGAGDHAGWLGAVVLLAGVLWFSCSRAALGIGVVAALLSVTAAQAVGPRARWLDLFGPSAGEPLFQTLNTAPTYGPLTDRRTGAPMLEIAAPEPALWRMQTLDAFDGTEWAVSFTRLPELPQPAARTEDVNVRVLGLRNDMVVAPGRIEQLDARGKVTPVAGEAWRVAPELRAGSSYRVSADYVHATAHQLARDRAPIDPRARAYTRLESTPGGRAQREQLRHLLHAWLGLPLSALPDGALDPRVVALARRLSAGADSEWEVVTRVERFLLDGHRFRYTTRVPLPGPQPLVDFLLRDRAGYCQHFAGAAALLLRLAGVPARVVSGFATGTPTGAGRYTVRDLDAHDWIEVYFEGYGWVPFNPTPAAASATIADGIDPLTSSAPPRRGGGGLATNMALAVAPLAALAALAAAVASRRRRARRGTELMQELLERIARRTGARLEPSTTLSQLGAALARVGPRTAALAAETERARFAANAPAPARHARLRVARSLAGDLGVVRALQAHLPSLRRSPRRSVPPTTEERDHEQRQQ
jgi:transglutaminase-like putative cysteine protease